MDSFLADYARMDAADDRLEFSALTFQQECVAVQDQIISYFAASCELPRLPGRQEFCEWLDATYRGEIELPCQVFLNSATRVSTWAMYSALSVSGSKPCHV